MLECDFCGCYSPKPEKGWVAYPAEEHIAIDGPGVLVFCPTCAAAAFGYQPDAAAEHVCVWKPEPPATGDES